MVAAFRKTAQQRTKRTEDRKNGEKTVTRCLATGTCKASVNTINKAMEVENDQGVILARQPTMEELLIHSREIEKFEPNRGSFTSIKFREVPFPTTKDELFKRDKLQFQLINTICCLHFAAILSTLVMFWVGWDEETVEWKNSNSVEICKAIISLCTIIAFLCTMVVRNEQHKEGLNSKRFKVSKKQQKSQLSILLIVEYILILLHVPPFTARFAGKASWLDTCNIIVFSRVYIIYEAIRVRSPIWRLRRINFDTRGDQCKVSGVYYFKYLMNDDPLKFFLCSSSILMIFMAVSMQILERWEQPDLDFRVWLYYMIIVFTSVGLGDITCVTMLGRLLTMVAAAGGFVFLSISVGFLFEAIEMEETEMEIKENHLKIMALIQYRSFAAVIIQRAYRKHLRKERGEILDYEEDSCEHSNVYLLADFSDAREVIQEQMQLGNKQSLSHVARVTQSHVEKLSHDMKILIERLSFLPRKPKPPMETGPTNHWKKIRRGIRLAEARSSKLNPRRSMTINKGMKGRALVTE